MKVKNKKKNHQSKRVIYAIIQYVALFLPYVLILAIKHETYFTKQHTISMGFGCVACIIVAAIVAAKKIKLLKGIGGFVALILISYLMDTVIQDLTLIGIWGLVGYVVSLIFEALGKHEQKYLNAYIDKEVYEE